MIRVLSVFDFRAIQSLELHLEPVTFLIGAAGAGKSSVLDALRQHFGSPARASWSVEIEETGPALLGVLPGPIQPPEALESVVGCLSSARRQQVAALADRLLNGTLADNERSASGQYALGLALSLTCSGPRLLLLDLAEGPLHPRSQAALVPLLREWTAATGGQVLATTQSGYLLDQARYSEVRVLARSAELGTVAARLDEHEGWEKWKDEMNPGEFWSYVGESWVAPLVEARHESGYGALEEGAP